MVIKDMYSVVSDLHIRNCFQIIPIPNTYINLAQFDWSRANSKQHLYFYKSTAQECWNYFLRANFSNELSPLYLCFQCNMPNWEP